MISYRQADLIDTLRAKAKEVGFDFHYDGIDSKFYLFIYDPDHLWEASISLGNHNFQVHLVDNKSIREATANWGRCTGIFSDSQMKVVHSVIDHFIASMQQRGYKIQVKDDFVAKQRGTDDSKYYVIFELNK